MQRVLVTGGAGFIGSHTVDLLLARGYAVRVMDILQERVHPRGWPAYLPAEVELLRGDVRDAADWEKALAGVDYVYHLAAYQDYMPDFSSFFHVNTVSTALLYELIVSRGLPVRKVVLASSQSVYGEGTYRCPMHGILYPSFRSAEQLARGAWDIPCPHCGGPLEHLPLTEDAAHPHTAYGISKYALELAALALGRKHGIPAVCLRYSIVQGPRNSFHNTYSGICRIFTLRLLHGQPPPCYEDGRQLRDYVYVGDVARANLLVLEDPRADNRVFNVAGQLATSVLEYARLVADACDRRVDPLLTGDYRFGDTRHTVSSWAALAELGWRPEVPLATVVAEYVDWVRAQPEAEDAYARTEAQMRAARIIRRASG
jgi:dTDP-L-rhamnose 4-epimerase